MRPHGAGWRSGCTAAVALPRRCARCMSTASRSGTRRPRPDVEVGRARSAAVGRQRAVGAVAVGSATSVCRLGRSLGRVNLVRDDRRRALTPGSVITLVGPAGVGKTTLALHVADGVRQPLPRRCLAAASWPTSLRATRSSMHVAKTLGVRQQRGKTLLASVVSAFLDADALVVLDNCEHVLPSAGRADRRCSTGCPRLTLLATSREPLGISGERVRHVAPLPLPGPDTARRSRRPSCSSPRARESGVSIELDPPTAGRR